MSAFLLVSDQVISKNYKSKTKKTTGVEYASSASSIYSYSRSVAYSRTETFVLGKENHRKKVFDIGTNSYVEFVPPAYEQSVYKYSEALENLKCSPYDKFNELLNHKHTFDLKSIEMFRYTYFEDLNYNSVTSFRLNQKKPNGDYKLSYMNKISRLTKSTEQGLPRFSLCESESEDVNYEEQDDVYQRNQNIRAILLSQQFWNNVLQEMKFESLQSKINYIEYLPSLSQLKNFYHEILEYFLCNIHILKPETEGVTDPEEIIQLQNCHYIYFTELNYEYFRIMKLEHDKLFRNCQDINHLYIVFEKLLDIMTANIKAMSGNRQNPVLPLWEQFLEFLIFDLLSQDYETDTVQVASNITTNSSTAYIYNPPRNMLVSSKGSQQSSLSMGKFTRNSSICNSDRSPISSPIMEELVTPVATEHSKNTSHSMNSEVLIKPKKPSILRRFFSSKKN